MESSKLQWVVISDIRYQRIAFKQVFGFDLPSYNPPDDEDLDSAGENGHNN